MHTNRKKFLSVDTDKRGLKKDGVYKQEEEEEEEARECAETFFMFSLSVRTKVFFWVCLFSFFITVQTVPVGD